MSNIFLNEDQLDERINSLLTRKNKVFGGELSSHPKLTVSINKSTNSATVSL